MQSSALLRSVALEYVPPLHGSGAPAPSAQKDPGSHAAEHAVAPDAPWYVPGAHRVQVALPSLPAMVPGEQSTHAEIAVLPGTW